MYLQFYDELIPGTKLNRSEMDGLTGLAFLKKVFFVSKKFYQQSIFRESIRPHSRTGQSAVGLQTATSSAMIWIRLRIS